MAGRHVFVCTNHRSSGKPACGPRGGDALVAAVQRELLARGAIDVLITNCGCLGPCFDGPNAVVYPDGVWYSGLAPDDATGLVDHLVDGRVFVAKISQRPGPESGPSPIGARDPEGPGGEDPEDGNAGRR